VVKKNRRKSSREIFDAIYEAVKDFADSDHIFDDLTMIILKRLPEK
jgi:serine phosphatase RsbU (regulator of sigma subunit)